MLHQSVWNALPHRVKDEVYSFAACHFGRRNKVGVTSNQDNLIDLFFEGKGRYIHADTHIDALLLGVNFHIGVCKVCNLNFALEKLFDFLWLDCS